MLADIDDECDEYPIRVQIDFRDDSGDVEDKFIELDENNWELLGTKKDDSFLNIPTK